MKKLIVLLSTFLAGMLNPYPETSNSGAFKPGEWFQFRVHYGIFNASFATLELEDTRLNGKPVYHVVGKGKTVGLARLFFKVEDNYESYFDKEDGKPYRFIRQIDEGGHTKDLEINFDHANREAFVRDHKHNETKTLKTEENIQDLLSAFYYLRNNYDTANLYEGKEVVLNMLFDNKEVFKFKLKFLGRETVNTKFGKVPCLKFRPYVQSGRVFKEQESLTMWVSDDENKIPIRIKADLRVGSLKADLNAFKGLKHQFKILPD
ncbi:MAG: DUF3108 domain-containing protein [Sinomicrobium sp.]|nr:DUF3108 domain-containing protein [Sinomicrobium sp.]